MLPEKIQIKLPIQSEIDLSQIVLTFHRWIQEDRLEGLLMLDVANYGHVPDGPGVLLIGHEADIAIDLGGGQPGILYKQKRGWPDSALTLAGRIAHVRRQVNHIAANLVAELELIVSMDEGEILFPDRLNAPNTAESFDELKSILLNKNVSILGGLPIDLYRLSQDDRKMLGLRFRLDSVAVGALIGD